jgi:dTDP-4-dehydrorhamnose reductase
MASGKILILGAKGMLGRQLVEVFGDEAVGWDRQECDVVKIEDLRLKIENLKPKAIINCVAYNDVDGAEKSQELALRINAEAVGNLAKICRLLDIPLVHFSTNYVFDGVKGEYREDDQPRPLSVYAESKFQGELELKNNTDKFYLIRTAVLFGPEGHSPSSKKSFVQLMLDLSKTSKAIRAVNDEINSLTYAVDLAGAVKLLLEEQKPFGVYHIVNSGEASWFEFAREIFAITRQSIRLIPVTAKAFVQQAERPQKAVLINTKLPPLRPWEDALRDFLES